MALTEAKKQPKASLAKQQADGKGSVSFYEQFNVNTAVPKDDLMALVKPLCSVPEGFHLNPKLAKQLERRRQTIEEGKGIDWGTGEALAFATILMQGHPIRLSGEDSQRGTFCHRHSVLFDIKTNAEYIPLSNLGNDQSPFFILQQPCCPRPGC